MDFFTVQDGVVDRVWRGHQPAGVYPIMSAKPNTVTVGMIVQGNTFTAPTVIVTPDQVKAECQRRILARWPVVQQLTINRIGGTAATGMTTEIDRYRAVSRALCALDPIPVDYRSDRHWVLGDIEALAIAASTAPQPAQQAIVVSPAPVAQQPVYFQPQAQQQPVVVVVPSQTQAPSQPVVVSPNVTVQGAAGLPAVVDPGHTAVTSVAVPGQPPPSPRASAARDGGGGPDPMRTAIDLAEIGRVSIWSQGDEIAAEAASRALQGHGESAALIEPRAVALGMHIEDYSRWILEKRARAQVSLLKIDDAFRSATVLIGAGQTNDGLDLIEQAIREARQ